MICTPTTIGAATVTGLSFAGVFLILGLASIIAGTFRRIATEREREETKRELAAHLAEGTLSQDQVLEILRAQPGQRPPSPQASPAS